MEAIVFGCRLMFHLGFLDLDAIEQDRKKAEEAVQMHSSRWNLSQQLGLDRKRQEVGQAVKKHCMT